MDAFWMLDQYSNGTNFWMLILKLRWFLETLSKLFVKNSDHIINYFDDSFGPLESAIPIPTVRINSKLLKVWIVIYL